MNTTMKAVQARRFGGPEVLEVVDLPIPQPGPGEVRIRVDAAAMNFSDVMRRRNSPYPFPTELPYTPGSEVAGTVDAVGDGVDLEPGQTVFAVVGRSGEGGYAQYAVTNALYAMPVPGDMPADIACTLSVAGATAALLIDEAARVTSEHTVFVPAAAGGVGSLLVQLAKARGAKVIAAASTEAKRARALELGADAAVAYGDRLVAAIRELAPEGVDFAFEMRGGDSLNQTVMALAPFGSVIVYGHASAGDVSFDTAAYKHVFQEPALNQSIVSFNLGLYFGLAPDKARNAMGTLVHAVATGTVRVPIDDTVPLSGVSNAHARLEARETSGKLIVHPWESE